MPRDTRPEYNDTNNESGLLNLGSLPSLAPVAAFNPDMTESLIKTKGIVALHYKHALNPDRETFAGGVNPNTNAAKLGFRYYSVRQFKMVPQQFKLSDQLNVQGIWTLGSVLINVAGHYDDGPKEHAFFRPHDVIVIQSACDGSSITTLTQQMSEFNPVGPLKLNFRCEGVDYLADKHREYQEGQDFVVQDGKIFWLERGFKPSMSTDGKGEILTVVYWIKPLYIVESVPHALRITPGNEMGNAAYPRKAHYAPQLVVAKQSWAGVDESDLLDFSSLPSYNQYRDSNNVTGGS